MPKENLELVRCAFHEALRNCRGLHLEETYEGHALMYVCGTLSVQNKRGFANFLENLSILPKLKKRLGDKRDTYSWDPTVLDFLVVQVAAILLGDGEWIPIGGSGLYPRKYINLYNFLFNWSEIDNPKPLGKLRAFGITKNVKQAVENGNASVLKLLVDLAPNPEKRLKNIYCYLFNNRKRHLAEQLHSLAGKMDELVPAEYLFTYWYRCGKSFQEEWHRPEQHPLHHLVAKGPFNYHAVNYLRQMIEFDENTFQEFQDNGISPDATMFLAVCPDLTLRKLMHFFAEFADDLLAAAEYCGSKNRALLNQLRSAKNFVVWEQKRQAAQPHNKA